MPHFLTTHRKIVSIVFIFKSVAPLQQYLTTQKQAGNRIGFVPTMGALHTGHISLLQYSLAQTQVSVCSIFVNPTQFNEKEDFDKYPRTVEADIELLEKNGCHVLFLPDVSEIYPPHATDIAPTFDFGYLDQTMEGAHRPGHFNGVAQVVHRLLSIVQPDALFMGQKDYQQVKIVNSMLRQTQSPVQLVMCPTLREADGLAMSSRNVRLSPQERLLAPHIYQALLLAAQNLHEHTPAQAKNAALQYLRQYLPDAPVEYLEIADADTLRLPDEQNYHIPLVICIALRLGSVRLIDNLPVYPKKT